MFTDFPNFFIGRFCGKFVIKWLLNKQSHLIVVSLRYLVKYKFSKVTIIALNIYDITCASNFLL